MAGPPGRPRRRRRSPWVVAGVAGLAVVVVLAGVVLGLWRAGVGPFAPVGGGTPSGPVTPAGTPPPTAPPTSSPTPAPTATTATPPATPSATPTAKTRPTVVFLDPGHGANVTPTAATSGGSAGIYSGENSSGGNEDADVMAVALQAQTQLRAAGYTVVLSRSGQPDPARQTLWQKGLAAEKAADGRPADIGVSIHTDLRSSIGAGQIYYDNMGGYRTNNSDGVTATFTAQATATLSQQYATAFQTVRQAAQGATITMTAGHDFPASRNLGSHGTIPIIMLTAQHVPWVYNEMARTTSAGLSAADIALYATALAHGVEACLSATQPVA